MHPKIAQDRVRTVMCQRGASCTYGPKCAFAHSPNEIRPMELNKPFDDYKTMRCKALKLENCFLRERCHFVHSDETELVASDERWFFSNTHTIRALANERGLLLLYTYPTELIGSLDDRPRIPGDIIERYPALADALSNRSSQSTSVLSNASDHKIRTARVDFPELPSNRSTNSIKQSAQVAEVKDAPEFDCDICYHAMDEGVHLPRVMNCGHTVCDECIKRVITSDNLCPECREPITSVNTNVFILRKSVPFKQVFVDRVVNRVLMVLSCAEYRL